MALGEGSARPRFVRQPVPAHVFGGQHFLDQMATMTQPMAQLMRVNLADVKPAPLAQSAQS
jgi:hypothetical protein